MMATIVTAETWLALEDIMLSEISQVETNIKRFHLYVGSEKQNNPPTKKQTVAFATAKPLDSMHIPNKATVSTKLEF